MDVEKEIRKYIGRYPPNYPGISKPLIGLVNTVESEIDISITRQIQQDYSRYPDFNGIHPLTYSGAKEYAYKLNILFNIAIPVL